MAAIRTVFLSSTGADLREYRDAAFLALQKLDDWKCVRMEDFGARAWDVDTFCRAEVKRCDLFIGIIGHRFGGAGRGTAGPGVVGPGPKPAGTRAVVPQGYAGPLHHRPSGQS